MKQLLIAGVTFFVVGCNQGENRTTETTDSATNADTANAFRPAPQIRLELNITDKLVHVLKQEDTIRTYPIAVGKAKYPTPTGEFKIHQIDWNPDWTPPDSEWSKDESYKKPGEKDNPMGRVRIIYQSPYSLHGTKDLASLGEAESHGSVRMANKDVIDLARLIMEETGENRPPEWYENVLRDSTTMQTINLRDSIPLTNRK